MSEVNATLCERGTIAPSGKGMVEEYDRDVILVARLAGYGYSCQEIADDLNASRSYKRTRQSIHEILIKIRAVAAEEVAADYKQFCAGCVARMNSLIRFCWIELQKGLQGLS